MSCRSGRSAMAAWIKAVLPAPAGPRIRSESRFLIASASRCRSPDEPNRGEVGCMGDVLLFHDQHAAMCHPRKVLRGSSPKVFVDSRMPMKADDEQIVSTCSSEINNRLHFMSSDNRGLECDAVQSRTPLGLSTELPEVAVLRILRLVNLHHRLGIAWYVLLDADHVQAGLKLQGQFYSGVKSLLRSVRTVVGNQDLLKHFRRPSPSALVSCSHPRSR